MKTLYGKKLIYFHTISIGLLTLVLIICPTTVLGATATLDLNSLPSAQGWIYLDGGTGIPESQIFSVSGGILHQDTINTGINAAWYYRLPNVVDPNLPFTLTVRARATQQDQNQQNEADSFIFGVDTGTELFTIALGPSLIEDASDNTISTTIDNTYFHDYILKGTPGVGYQIFVDNVLIGTGAPRVIAGTNSIFLGDATNATNSTGDTASYSFEQGENNSILGGDGGFIADDGRVNRYDAFATYAVYCKDFGIVVYNIDPQTSRGYLALVAYTEEIESVDTLPVHNTLIDSGGGIHLYRLTTSEFQVMDSSNWEGKIYTVIFDQCPATEIYTTQR